MTMFQRLWDLWWFDLYCFCSLCTVRLTASNVSVSAIPIDQILSFPFRFLPVMPDTIPHPISEPPVNILQFDLNTGHPEQQVTLRGQSKSTLNNYIRRIALFVVHFGKLPEQIDPEEINEYLAALALDLRSPSRSIFKHMMSGLRYYYRLPGMNKNAIALPSLKKDTKLPVILNHQELSKNTMKN